jgi:hypothetical protein
VTNIQKKLPRILLAYFLLQILVTTSGFSEYHMVANSLGDLAEETLCDMIRFMNVQHHYQILQHRSMNQLTSIAQSHHRNVDQQVTQIEELQATITAKNEAIAQRDETIIHRED